MSRKERSAENTDGERKVLVLQGGGALGAYQAGVYEELAARGYAPDWVSGISIGAINAALIAGNPPDRRIERLRAFWEMVSSSLLAEPAVPGELARMFFNEASASFSAMFGVPGFYGPRIPPAFAMPLTNPSCPPWPYRFVDREFFVITYRTDRAALRAVVPESLELRHHALAQVTGLPVLEVLSGVHILTDLTLGLGEVAHDYLKD